MATSKEQLFAVELEQVPYEVVGKGEVVLRQLSHGEVVDLKKKIADGMGGHSLDAHVLVLGFVDPPLTEDEAERWVMTAPGTLIDPIIVKIMEMAGLRRPGIPSSFQQ